MHHTDDATSPEGASAPPSARTLGALRASGWRSRTVREELRGNLIERLRRGDTVVPGIVGYDETVLPQVQNALLAGHDLLLLGLRGQAKTRILRGLADLLDEWLPYVEGSSLRDDPYAPIGADARRMAREQGDDLPVAWLHRSERYHEKLATPDVTVADLIGDLDPIKAANRRLEFTDPEVLHFGILPRSNRGIFAVNELPDLPTRVQVALLNVLEEGDVQVRGIPMRLPLDVWLCFSANPEDYTSRGSIITPLRDRIASQVLTHYPRTVDEALRITAQEARVEREGGVPVHVPEFLRIAVEEAAFQARASDFVDQKSGVSARMTIALLETVVSNAERRAMVAGEATATARPSDLLAGIPALSGKLELVYDGEREGVGAVSAMVLGKALGSVFSERFPDAYAEDEEAAGGPYGALLEWFRSGNALDLADDLPAAELAGRLSVLPGLADLVRERLAPRDEGELLAGMELVVEGLHQCSLLAREDLGSRRQYRDMLADMARSLGQ